MFQHNLFSQPDQKPLDILDRLITVGSKIIFPTTTAIALLGSVSCSTKVQLDSPTTVQTQTSSALDSSVSSNQTESPGDVATTSGFQKITVVENLEHPWSLAWLPDGAILITERPGRLRIVRDGVL
ncbi:MAG: PQQ-dependent sugar dehydrogenase, partial [Microcoleaceae cyanobacterium]